MTTKDIPFKNNEFAIGPDNRAIFVLKENGKQYRALNDSQKYCLQLQIDKGILSSEQERKCDKGLIVIDDDKCILVELKGCDISSACKQLLLTLNEFSLKLLAKFNYEYYCRAIVTKMPSPNNYPTSYKMLLKVLKNDKKRLVFKSVEFEEKI